MSKVCFGVHPVSSRQAYTIPGAGLPMYSGSLPTDAVIIRQMEPQSGTIPKSMGQRRSGFVANQGTFVSVSCLADLNQFLVGQFCVVSAEYAVYIILCLICNVQTCFSQFIAIGFCSCYQDFFIFVIFLQEISGISSGSDKFLFCSFNAPVMKLLYIISGCFGWIVGKKAENSAIFLYCIKKVCRTREKFTSQSNGSVDIQEEQLFFLLSLMQGHAAY